MAKQSCGYRGLGHYCTDGKALFISRYRGENDYCIGGKRVQVSDDGVAHNATPEDLQLIYDLEWAQYQDYLKWRETCDLAGTETLPFDAGIGIAIAAKEQMRSKLVVCDAVETPHSYAVCSCTEGHKYPRLA